MNTCPNCGMVKGMHASILPGCKCPWTPQETDPESAYQRGYLDGIGRECPHCKDYKVMYLKVRDELAAAQQITQRQTVNAMTSNFCPRCGKRRGGDVNYIHTCTPPRGLEMT